MFDIALYKKARRLEATLQPVDNNQQDKGPHLKYLQKDKALSWMA